MEAMHLAVVTRGKASGVEATPSLKVRANPMGNHAADSSAHTASIGGVEYIITLGRKCPGGDRYRHKKGIE